MTIDLTKILRPYPGQWVTISQDEKRVLGHGKTIDEAIKMAKKKEPKERPLLYKVPGGTDKLDTKCPCPEHDDVIVKRTDLEKVLDYLYEEVLKSLKNQMDIQE